jgi:hypothetical protein
MIHISPQVHQSSAYNGSDLYLGEGPRNNLAYRAMAMGIPEASRPGFAIGTARIANSSSRIHPVDQSEDSNPILMFYTYLELC